jgi:hypothetical protein
MGVVLKLKPNNIAQFKQHAMWQQQHGSSNSNGSTAAGQNIYTCYKSVSDQKP